MRAPLSTALTPDSGLRTFKTMWDRKRQIIWLTVGLLFGTFSLYPIARDDAGRFDLQYFLQLETLLLLIITVMFYIYGRKSEK
jgi:hypothetical protein